MQRLTGDEASAGAGQPHDGAADFVGAAAPPEQGLVIGVMSGRRRRARGLAHGIHHAGRDAINGDAEFRELVRQCAGEAAKRRLGRHDVPH